MDIEEFLSKMHNDCYTDIVNRFVTGRFIESVPTVNIRVENVEKLHRIEIYHTQNGLLFYVTFHLRSVIFFSHFDIRSKTFLFDNCVFYICVCKNKSNFMFLII